MRVRLLLALVCLVPVTLPAQSPRGIGIGLVRADGTLQPLARLVGGAWTDVPEPEATGTWQLWLFDDPVVRASPFAPRAPRPIAAAVPATGSGCLRVTLDPTWLAGTEASSGTALIGVALSGTDIRPDIPLEVAVDSDMGRELAAKAAVAFHRSEDETLILQREELPRDFPPFAVRRTRPIAWTRIVRQGVAQAATNAYYLEGAKDYDVGRIRTTGHVFVRVAGARETIDAEVDLSDVDGHQSIFRRPLAILTWPERAAWLFAMHGAEGEGLELMDVTPGPHRPRSIWQGPAGCTRGER